jgi:hypothetical protein
LSDLVKHGIWIQQKKVTGAFLQVELYGALWIVPRLRV